MSERVRQALRQAPLPGEAGAADRAWALVERAFESRERISRTRKRRGPLVALVAAGAILAGRSRHPASEGSSAPASPVAPAVAHAVAAPARTSLAGFRPMAEVTATVVTVSP